MHQFIYASGLLGYYHFSVHHFYLQSKIPLNNSEKIERRVRSQIKYGKQKIFNFRLKTSEELISPAQSSTHGNHLSRRIGVEVEEPHLFASANPATRFHTIQMKHMDQTWNLLAYQEHMLVPTRIQSNGMKFLHQQLRMDVCYAGMVLASSMWRSQ